MSEAPEYGVPLEVRLKLAELDRQRFRELTSFLLGFVEGLAPQLIRRDVRQSLAQTTATIGMLVDAGQKEKGLVKAKSLMDQDLGKLKREALSKTYDKGRAYEAHALAKRGGFADARELREFLHERSKSLQ